MPRDELSRLHLLPYHLRRYAMSDKEQRRPLRIINSVAPIRICDNGGWTDTWFAKYGKIFNLGVYPYAEVQIEVYPIEAGSTPSSPKMVPAPRALSEETLKPNASPQPRNSGPTVSAAK